MLKKTFAMALVAGVLLVGATPTEAAKLQAPKNVKNHTATIVVEDFSQDGYVKVINLSGIKSMRAAIQWVEDNAAGRNLRFVSIDSELLDDWKQATCDAGYKVKNPEENYRKVSDKAIKTLKRGDNVSFEIKNIKKDNNVAQDIAAGASFATALWAALS